MRVLITGVTGLVGSHLADFLVERPEVEVHGLKRWRSDDRTIRHFDGRVTLHEGDIGDPFALDSLVREVRPDRLFHLAAQSYPKESWDAPVATLQANVLGTVHVLEAVRRHVPRCQVHIAGSSAEYGIIRPEEVPIREDHPLWPVSPYGVSKVASELLGFQYSINYGMSIFLTRSFNHVGPRQGERSAIQAFCKQMAAIEAGDRPPILYVGNLDTRRDFTAVGDVVRALWLLLEKGRPAEAYNLCSGVAPSMREVLDLVLAAGSVPVEVRVDPARLRPTDEPILLGDNTKLRRDTGWQPLAGLADTVQQILDYWRQRSAEARPGRRE